MPLKILVTAKRVEDPESKISVKPDGTGIVTEGLNYKINPFDEIAVEEASAAEGKHGGEVMVASIGGRQVPDRDPPALAMGADRGLWSARGGAGPGVGRGDPGEGRRAREARPRHPRQAEIDDDQNQTGQYLAERLGWSQATFASKTRVLESEAEQKKHPASSRSPPTGRSSPWCARWTAGSTTLEVSLPAVVTTDLRLNKPRFASLPGIMKAKKKEVKELPAAELGVDAAPQVMVKKLSAPPAQGGIKVGGRERAVGEAARTKRRSSEAIATERDHVQRPHRGGASRAGISKGDPQRARRGAGARAADRSGTLTVPSWARTPRRSPTS